MEEYVLEKSIWTEADFDVMGWHDNSIYKMRVDVDLELDIDYIFKWNKPELEGLSFTFWIAPATLVFKQPTQLKFDIEVGFQASLEIEDIEREFTESGTKWLITTREGTIEFLSSGYTQFIRQKPFFKFHQYIEYDERNGYSLEQTTNQNNPNRFSQEMETRRSKELADYEIVKKRHVAVMEKEQLELSKENGAIDLKKYLVRKRELSTLVSDFDQHLRDTHFNNQ